MHKFYIVDGNRYGESAVLRRYGFEEVFTMEEADFVVFTGGADINPALYGEEAHGSVYFNKARDASELAAYKAATGLGKAFLGICRGAQFLNVMAGGKLYQDIGHPGYHELVTEDGQRFMSNSVHHQMLRVGKGAIIKAWAENLSNGHHLYMEGGEEQNDEVVEKEPEIVIYPEHRMVLVQGHPEFNSYDEALHTFRQFVFNLVTETLEK